MKTLLTGCLVLLFATVGAVGAPDPPPQYTLANLPNVLLAKVDSIKNGKITFLILKVWKGKSPGPLLLTSEEVDLKIGDECVLCGETKSSNTGTVSESYMLGDVDWMCLPVQTEADKRQFKAWALSKS